MTLDLVEVDEGEMRESESGSPPLQLYIHTLLPFLIEGSSKHCPQYSAWMSNNDENLDQSIIHATLIRPRGYTHRNEAVRPCCLQSPFNDRTGREDTEIGQEYAWPQHPKRGSGKAVETGRCRRVAGAEEG